MHSPTAEPMRLGFVGGTGPEGRGLALRFAAAGQPVILGSRSRERANEAVHELQSILSGTHVRPATNSEVAADADIVFLTIPYAAVPDTLGELEGALRDKIVVSTIAPVDWDDGRPVAKHVPAGSAAQEVAERLPQSRVASAFQTVDAHVLQHLDTPLETDVIVCSDDVEARRTVVGLANTIAGIRALSGGRLSTSRYVEECTTLLIILNRIYKSHSGIRITGINR